MARQVPAVARALEILELFLTSGELSSPEIAALLDLPRSSTHELISTLLDRGYLAPSLSDSRKFRLGIRAFELGSRYMEGIDLAREGQAVAEQVAGGCRETVHVMVRDASHVVYIAKVDSVHPVRMVSAVGRRLPAHCTAGGKVLLSALSDSEFDALYPRRKSLPPMTPRSITDRDTLRSALGEIRSTGLGWEYCESNDAVACVAAPVRDASGSMVAAMSASVPILRWSEDTKPQLARAVKDGTAELSRRLGYMDRHAIM